MPFPHITTKATNFTITPQLHALLDQKLAPLEKFLDTRGETLCEVELEKIGEHQSGKIFRAEINLQTSGKLFRAEATEEQMERAIDEVRDDLKRELRKAHDKQKSLLKKGGQMVKNALRFGK